MNEAQKAEYKELQNLEAAGTLEDAKKPLLDLYRAMETVEKTAETKSNELKTVLAQKDHFREKSEKAEAERIALEKKLSESAGGNPPAIKPFEVEDFLDISASLEGLDTREKEYLAGLHKLTGRSLKEIREGEDFLLWREGHKIKVEKERALKPNGIQGDDEGPKSLSSELSRVSRGKSLRNSMEEAEKLLKSAGLYKDPRAGAQRSSINK